MDLKENSIMLFILLVIGFEVAVSEYVTIIPATRNVQKFINDSYFVSCTTKDDHMRADWFNPKTQRIDSNPRSRIRVEKGFGIDLFLTRITTQDSGPYTCVTQRGRASFNLTVIRPIVFNMNLAEQSASEGKDYTMRCDARAQGRPLIYWKVDNRNPSPPKFKTLPDGLLIRNVTQQDSKRMYACRAMDIHSPIPDSKIMNISLKVKMKPRMVPGARSEHWGVLGEWANLTCAVNAEPPARFQWFHKNVALNRNDEVSILQPQDNISILQVLVRSESKFGPYKCRASNDQGTMTKDMVLYKGQKPATPVLEVDMVASDGAKIRVKDFRPSSSDRSRGGRRGKPLPIIGYVVEYKMLTRPSWKMANSSKYESGFIIRGLNPGITYQVRAASKNQASIGEFSQSITIVTSTSTSWSIGGQPSQHSISTPLVISPLLLLYLLASIIN